ncbi:MAG: SixA phosphatase family protein [Bacteroidia bacterium]
MKVLGLIRHAKSDWDNPDLEDFERPLNARGYRDARRMAEQIKARGYTPDYILSSTAIRAASTALIFSRFFRLSNTNIGFDPRLYACTEKAFMDVLKSLPPSASTCFVFGHNETLSQIAAHLTDDKVAEVPTCGVVILQANSTRWEELEEGELLLFDYPKKFSPE